MTANTSPSTTINAGAFTKLQILLPGETAAPGTATGKTGTPSAQTAGGSLQRHRQRGRRQLEPRQLHRHRRRSPRTDANATLPANTALVAGTKTFSVTPKTAGSTTFTATDITQRADDRQHEPGDDDQRRRVREAPDPAPGRDRRPGHRHRQDRHARPRRPPARSFNVTVNAVDANWNVVSSTDTVGDHHAPTPTRRCPPTPRSSPARRPSRSPRRRRAPRRSRRPTSRTAR